MGYMLGTIVGLVIGVCAQFAFGYEYLIAITVNLFLVFLFGKLFEIAEKR